MLRRIDRWTRKELPAKGYDSTPFQEAVDQGIIQLKRFPKWKECVSYMEAQNIFLVGVEIDDSSQLFDDDYFERNFADNSKSKVGILMGNEGQGIQPAHLKHCQQLIRIPQHGAGTASMNVNVATNIVLYKFQEWKRKTKSQGDP